MVGLSLYIHRITCAGGVHICWNEIPLMHGLIILYTYIAMYMYVCTKLKSSLSAWLTVTSITQPCLYWLKVACFGNVELYYTKHAPGFLKLLWPFIKSVSVYACVSVSKPISKHSHQIKQMLWLSSHLHRKWELLFILWMAIASVIKHIINA